MHEAQKPIRVILVGCGYMAGGWLAAIANIETVEIVGLVDLKLANTEKQAKAYDLKEARCFGDLKQAIDTLTPDAVFDCTVPAAHEGVTLTALKAGCHVLGEKPISESMASAIKMVRAAKAADRIYSVIQNRRYQQPIRSIRKSIESGLIGKLHTINADFYLGPHFGGFRETMDHVLLIDMAIHTFDQARYLSDKQPKAVYCHEYNPEDSWYQHGACATGIFEMEDGCVFNYSGSWCAEGLQTSWQGQWRLIGSEGTILWDGESGIQLERRSGNEGFFRQTTQTEVPLIDWGSSDDGHEGLIRDFVKAVHSGVPPMTRADDNLYSLAMVFGAIESAQSAQRTEIIINL